MSFWRNVFTKLGPAPTEPRRLDYLNEALALERQGDYTAALTSYRLGLRDNPNDPRILQNMAIAFTKTGQPDEAIRHYRKALDLDSGLSGAHYGLAFLLLKRGDAEKAADHLRAFLARPPRGADGERWIKHAEGTLSTLETTHEQRVSAVSSA
jgi:tetratricopeptide (TPR) repeat protein